MTTQHPANNLYPANNPPVKVRTEPTLSRYTKSGDFRINATAYKLLGTPEFINAQFSADSVGLRVRPAGRADGVRVRVEAGRVDSGGIFSDQPLWDRLGEKLRLLGTHNAHWALTQCEHHDLRANAKQFEQRAVLKDRREAIESAQVAHTMVSQEDIAVYIKALDHDIRFGFDDDSSELTYVSAGEPVSGEMHFEIQTHKDGIAILVENDLTNYTAGPSRAFDYDKAFELIQAVEATGAVFTAVPENNFVVGLPTIDGMVLHERYSAELRLHCNAVQALLVWRNAAVNAAIEVWSAQANMDKVEPSHRALGRVRQWAQADDDGRQVVLRTAAPNTEHDLLVVSEVFDVLSGMFEQPSPYMWTSDAVECLMSGLVKLNDASGAYDAAATAMRDYRARRTSNGG